MPRLDLLTTNYKIRSKGAQALLNTPSEARKGKGQSASKTKVRECGGSKLKYRVGK